MCPYIDRMQRIGFAIPIENRAEDILFLLFSSLIHKDFDIRKQPLEAAVSIRSNWESVYQGGEVVSRYPVSSTLKDPDRGVQLLGKNDDPSETNTRQSGRSSRDNPIRLEKRDRESRR
jgi:hypothetical protein